MTSTAETLRAIVRTQRAQVFGMVEIRGVRRMNRIYDLARVDLENRLADLRRRGLGQTFTAAHLNVVYRQVLDALQALQNQMRAHLGVEGPQIARLGGDHMVNSLERLQRAFRSTTPILPQHEIAVFSRALPAIDSSLLARYPSSVATYGPPTIRAIEEKMAISLAKNATVDEAIDAVASADGALAAQRWRADRIVRTEMAYSYGVAKQTSMQQVRARVPQMMKRLVATFDDRTGEDSIELHGQTVPVDQPFVWVVKNRKGIPTGKIVRYMQPPNRPNDREISIPWVQGWPEDELARPRDVTPQVPSGL